MRAIASTLITLNDSSDVSQPEFSSKQCFHRQPLPSVPQRACIHRGAFAGFAENHRASDFASSSSLALSSGMKSIPVTLSITRTDTTNLLRSVTPRSARCGIRNPTATRFPLTRATTTLNKCIGIGTVTPSLPAANSTLFPGGNAAEEPAHPPTLFRRKLSPASGISLARYTRWAAGGRSEVTSSSRT